jgi:dienelactone hydrolase
VVVTQADIEQAVRLRLADGAVVDGDLAVPPQPIGVVVFAHGSGSSRHSPRNRAVAEGLRARQLGTLLLDLLTAEEERVDARTRHLRFDVETLAERLAAAAQWVAEEGVPGHPIGYFGASTGAAAALIAAAREPEHIGAIVSRGGRPDLAGDDLPRVRAPTLLIVGGRDDVVIQLNREAYDRLRCEKRLEIVPGATHLFEEPGALDLVTRLAGDWFVHHLRVV